MTAVNEYFAGKAEKYDDVDLQPYWVFSDELLWELLKAKALPNEQKGEFELLDAGAGTARWSAKTLLHFPNATASLVDISAEMLSEAQQKLDHLKLSHRAHIRVDDVRKMDHIENGSIDVIYCLHNVIGFFENTVDAIFTFFKKLKKGGKCAVMFPSFYHAIYFSNSTGRVGQLEKITKNRRVQYNDLMPPLKVFEVEEINFFAQIAGFEKVECYGFPLTIYPGMDETFLHGSTAQLVKMFEEPHRSNLMEIEKRLCLKSDLCSRGNNILAVFEK